MLRTVLLLLVTVGLAHGNNKVKQYNEENKRMGTQAVSVFESLDLPISLAVCLSSTSCPPFVVDAHLTTAAVITVDGLTNKLPLLCGNAVANGFLHPDFLTPVDITVNCNIANPTQGCGIRIFAGNFLGLSIGITDLLDTTLRVATSLGSILTGLALPVDADVQITAHVSLLGNTWNVDLDVCVLGGACQHQVGIHVAVDGLIDVGATLWNIMLVTCRGAVMTHVSVDADVGVGHKERIASAARQ